MATGFASRRRNGDGAAKATAADHISQSVQSTSNLLHRMQQSSPAQAQLVKLPKNLLAKAPTVKNTEKILEQMPQVVSHLDAYVEKGLESIPHLQTVVQLLANMESSQLKSLSQFQHPQEYCIFVASIDICLTGMIRFINRTTTTSSFRLQNLKYVAAPDLVKME